MNGFHYEWATFRFRVGPDVRVEVSLRGCKSNNELLDPDDLYQAGEICRRLATAIERIKRDVEPKPAAEEKV